MLDLTRNEKLKIEFKYDKDGQVTVFSFEGVVSYATLSVYEQTQRKIKLNATADKGGNASIDMSGVMSTLEEAEKEMLKKFFGDKYMEFEQAVKDNEESRHVILQYVHQSIMEHVEKLKSDKEEEKEGKKGNIPRTV